jgi:hypothetical protein
MKHQQLKKKYIKAIIWIGSILAALLLIGWIGLWQLRLSLERSIQQHHMPPGLIIANGGTKDIAQVRVEYPGGEYIINGLDATTPGKSVDERPIMLTGQIKITLRISYVDGTKYTRVIETLMPDKPQLFQINIGDEAKIHLR